MASDRQNYRNALRKWDRLKEAGSLSVPRNVGSVAVMCSYGEGRAPANLPPDRAAEFVSKQDSKKFRREALAIASVLRAQTRDPEVVFDAKASDFRDVLRDPSISDVIVIGHGGLSSVSIKDPSCKNTYTWIDVSHDADHLKTGTFTQRTCGHFNFSLSVPLGLFSVDDHRNVLAPVGYYFAPVNLDHPHNQLLRPVTYVPRMTCGQVRGAFPPQREGALPFSAPASVTPS